MTMTAEQSRQTGGYYAQQWTVRDEYAMGAMVAEANAAGRHGTSIDPVQLAQWSFRIADAMLTERRRGSGNELANDISEVLSRPYTDARGAVLPPAGAPSPEDVIRAGRGDLPAHEGGL